MPKQTQDKEKIKKQPSPILGAQAIPTTLDTTTKLDVDVNKKFIDNILEASTSSKLNMAMLEDFTNISNSRDQIYQLIDSMMKDSSVASIVRTYTEDVCETADNGHIVWCESTDPNISKFINYLLNVMNVDKNIFGWVYSLIKYGDVYLRLFRESDYKDQLFKKDTIDKINNTKSILNEEQIKENVYLNTHSITDPYSYYIEMVPDPGTMFELTKFGKTYGYIETPNIDREMNYLGGYTGTDQTAGAFNFKLRSNDVNVYQADDFVHAYLEDNYTRYPEKVNIYLNDEDYIAGKNSQAYTVRRGKSLLYDSYKIWREKSLLENSALLNRITKSSVVRTIQVEVGDMPKTQVQNTLRRVKDLLEQKSAIDTGNSMSEYNNPGPIENNIYLATHGGQGAVSIGTIGGDIEVKNLADLDYWNNKYYSSYGIPKQYFGWCLGKDTKIRLLDNSVHTIEELFNNKSEYIGKGIMGCNSDGSLCPTKISNIMLTNQHAQLMRLWLDNGKFVDTTPDHKMMLRNGSFIRADELVEGNSLMPFYTDVYDSGNNKGKRWVLDNKTGKRKLQFHLINENKFGLAETDYQIYNDDTDKLNTSIYEVNRLVTKIEYLSADNLVYDLTVEDNCHTFAIEAGIFVHNCDDGAGFNGGTSLTILSSVYAKGVKRIQNAILQALTDAINLILINKGCKAYLNNFVLKMKNPATQEEKDYRETLTNKINAISNMQSLFSDIEDKSRKLEILKNLISTLNYGDTLTGILDKEIAATEAEKLKQEQEKEAEENSKESDSTVEKEDSKPNAESDDFNLNLGDSLNLKTESLHNYATIKNIDEVYSLDESSEELPPPEELNKSKDFSIIE